jgi:predicted DNA-binding protein (MmcQ/YjbR family)
VDAAARRRCCLAQTRAVEDFPFGPEHSEFKVSDKMFAIRPLDRTPLEVSVKCDPDLAVQLRLTYSVIRPGHT